MAYLMIVDDDADYAGIVATTLRDAGHEVRTEPDLSSAMRSMEERRPDLLILEVMFPDDVGGGFRMARAIRHNHAKLRGIPIVMLTAVNQKSSFPLEFGPDDIDDYRLPVADFLDKPINLDVLRDEISDLLQKRGLSASDREKQRSRASCRRGTSENGHFRRLSPLHMESRRATYV